MVFTRLVGLRCEGEGGSCGHNRKMALSAADPSALEASLTQHVFLTGDAPSSVDAKVFEELGAQVPSSASHPYLYAWYVLMSLFTTKVKESWPAPPKPAAAKPAAAADDDVDLFGDDPEAEEEAKKLAAEKAGAHKVEVGKSNVIFEVKPASSSVNLDEVAQKITTLVVHEGLKWGEDFKKVPIGYGIFKLHIGCVVVDSISTDDLIDEILEIKGMVEADDEEEEEEDEQGNVIQKERGPVVMVEGQLVQSVDILKFIKI